jgi:hypothetical protein
VCAVWNWRNPAGQIKDMAARTLLLKLAARGLVELPPPQGRNNNGHRRAQPPPNNPCSLTLGLDQPLSITSPLAQLQPVRLEPAHTRAERERVRQLLRAHHYRGFTVVGENVQYLARDRHHRELAVMVFGAAAWQVAARDRFIGWSAPQRQARLGALANQQRFLILPWVRVPHLASHLLALASRRLSADWDQRYGHGIWLVETFVETDRFSGAAYRAAGWIRLGSTRGRTRQDRAHTLHVPVKAVWVRPLHPHFREHLTHP